MSTTVSTVVVERDGPRLSYHHPNQIASTVGMVEVPESEARAEGAVACSACFPSQDGYSYDFPYMRGVS